MTAIVGIINRNGAAFAADSAATHTLSDDNKKKITNHANKIFELSKYHPVGVAICGELGFMGVPWEDIFKLYRTQLDKNSFPHLNDYIQDFMQYVRSSILSKFKVEQKSYLATLLKEFRNELINIAINKLNEQEEVGDEVPIEKAFPIICEKLKEFTNVYSQEAMRCGNDFEGYSIEDFIQYAQEMIDAVMADFFNDERCPEDFKDRFAETFFNIVVSKRHVYLSTTEIVFWGHGEEELFPSCHSVILGIALDGRIKWTDGCNRIVSNDPASTAWITTFAQHDVCNTVVRGVDPILRDKFNDKTQEVLQKFKQDLVAKFDEINAPQDFKAVLSSISINPYYDLYKNDMNQYIKDNYVNKLINTVSYMMKEDLADMAESLVRMTCLKRHFTTDDETVGGPVDVAVITKGDGFVWIKRKHYFSSDINHHYFERKQ